MGALVFLGSFLLKRRGQEEPIERGSFREKLRSALKFRFQIIEDGREPRELRPGRPTSKPRGDSAAAEGYNPPLQLLRESDGYGIELNGNLSEDERVEEIVGLQELWDSTGHYSTEASTDEKNEN